MIKMSIHNDLKQINKDLDFITNQVIEFNKLFYSIINEIVRMHQEYRLAKNYEVSDRLRNILSSNGIRIIQGTKQFGGYENIPEHLRNETYDDRWEI